MLLHLSRLAGIAVIVGLCLYSYDGSLSQETVPVRDSGTPAVPKGVEVMARGPVHEAFATPAVDPAPTKPVSKKPPKPLDEMPPAERPEGEVVWVGGYWAWDDDRNDFLWVSGIWRDIPRSLRWSSLALVSSDHGPKRWRYSMDVMNALTISALVKSPLKTFNFVSQN